jgi:hypothetical protein
LFRPRRASGGFLFDFAFEMLYLCVGIFRVS